MTTRDPDEAAGDQGPASPAAPRRSKLAVEMLERRLHGRADMLRRRLRGDLAQLRDPHRFDSVASFVLFIGHTKSGGSLIGAFLDAHPDAVVGDETDVIRYSEAGFRRHQLFDVLVRGAAREAGKGRVTARRLEAYSLAVPGGWQGRYREVRVIGDSRAGPTTRRIASEPESLERLERLLGGIPIRFVQVVRNPVDPISAMMLRSGRSVDSAIDDYVAQCERLARLRSTLGSSVITVHYEEFVADPVTRLGGVCEAVGLPVLGEHLAACASVVDPHRVPESSKLEWSPSDLRRLKQAADRFDFLGRYADGV